MIDARSHPPFALVVGEDQALTEAARAALRRIGFARDDIKAVASAEAAGETFDLLPWYPAVLVIDGGNPKHLTLARLVRQRCADVTICTAIDAILALPRSAERRPHRSPQPWTQPASTSIDCYPSARA